MIYKTIEFDGPAISDLGMAGRMTLCNMTVDLGAKNGIIAPDQTTVDFLTPVQKGKWDFVTSDSDAVYEKVYEVDVTNLVPTISIPDKLDDVKRVEEVQGIKFNKAFVGTCTNGRLEDIEMMSRILKGKQ